MFHDVGNIGVSDMILLKRGSLKTEDWECMRRHTEIGEHLLEQVPLLTGEGLRVVRSHHERWDGSGYPDGLAGTDDPARRPHLLGRRRARRDDRPPALPPAVALGRSALTRISKAAGTQFDPDVVDGLLACEPDLDRDPPALPGGVERQAGGGGARASGRRCRGSSCPLPPRG